MQKIPFIWKNCATIVGFLFSLVTAVWSFVSLLLVLTTFKYEPNHEIWMWMLILTSWSLLTGIIFIIDLLLESYSFDWWLTGYLMLTWVGFTALAIWKAIAWFKLRAENEIYAEFAQMLVMDTIFLNVVYILAFFFPHDPPPILIH